MARRSSSARRSFPLTRSGLDYRDASGSRPTTLSQVSRYRSVSASRGHGASVKRNTRLRRGGSTRQVRPSDTDRPAVSGGAHPLQRERGRNHTGLGPSKRTRGELLKPRDTFGDFPLGSAFPSRGMTSTGRVSPGFTDVGSINEPPSTPVSNIGWLQSLCPARESASLEQTLAQNERAPHPERPVRCARADGTSLRTSCRF